MPGQATVKIRDKQWDCSVASTPTELVTGLSGMQSMPPNTGMLFDLGVSLTQVTIDMTQMLFAIDVVFMDLSGIVVGGVFGLQPGMMETVPSDRGIRYFLEVNTGEATGILLGDQAYIEMSGATTGWISPVVTFAGVMMVGVFMAKMGKTMASSMFPKKTLLYGPGGEKLLQTHPPPRLFSDRERLEFLPDSPEFLAYTIEDIGYRDKIDSTFLQAIARAKGGKR